MVPWRRGPMGKRLRAVATTCILLLTAFSFSVFLAPNVAATSRTWTTDTDFGEPGATFVATEVVGTGVGAKVELLKDSWMNMSPPSAPRAREGPGMAFDSFRNRSILFGGYNGAYLADTWEYDFPTNTWTEIPTNPHPIGLESPKMSYDLVEKVVVLHGGMNNTDPPYMSDTWEFDVVSNKWALSNPTGPRMDGLDSAMVYDSVARKHILVGLNLTNGQFQTWAYDAATNIWTLRTTGGPSPRWSHSLAYHDLRQRVVLFGGASGPSGTLYDDTWEYDDATTTWTMVTTPGQAPSSRRFAAMTYHSGSRSVILFGGMNSTVALNETWRYTERQSWIYTGAALIPPSRGLAGFTYDSSADAAVLFGGWDKNERLEDTWAYGAAYRAAGRYANEVLDSVCGDVEWKTISWNKTAQPANTFLRFQIATSDIVDPHLWLYVGPNGSFSSYYNTSGAAIWSGHDNNRYLRFLADFGSFDTRATPSMEDVTIDHFCPPAPPYIVFTDPVNLTVDVNMSKPVRVMFTKPMDTGSVTWQFLQGTPINFTPIWTEEDTFLNLTHTEKLAENEVYELQLFGRSKDGAELISNPIDPNVVNPWTFVTERVNPFITKEDPAQGAVDVQLNANIVIDFSEPMVPSTVEWKINPIISNSGTWTSGNTRLTLSHAQEFQDCTLYFVHVTKGEDRTGAPLSSGPKPNPWSFRTRCTHPFVAETYPYDLAMGVQVSSPILVNFSETMDPASVTWQLLKGIPVTFTPSWTDGNRRLKLIHQDFLGCMAYEIRIEGKDVDGNDLVPGPNPPGRPNPWTFMTVCANPFIFLSDPSNGAKNVSLDRSIIIGFSDTMNTTTVNWTITPQIRELPPVWFPQSGELFNSSLLIPHLGFEQCMRYTVNITSGRSMAGLPLILGPAPNPFFFDTICERPYILSTDPADGATLVPLDKSIVVEFSEPMNVSSLLFILDPDVTGKSYEWSNNNQTLTFGHTGAYVEGTLYFVFVDGVGADGNGLLINGPQVPDPWTFTTRFPGFFMASTDPPDMATSAPLDKKIVVIFSEAADPSSFSSSIVPGPTLAPDWSDGNSTVTLNHTTLFDECTWHTVTVTARDSGGNALITVPGSAPNPWKFRSACTPPYIVSTDPPDGEIYVPINKSVVITFSEQMNRASVTWTISPAFQMNGSWTNGDRVLTLSSPTPFKTVKTYCIGISGKDLDDMPLVPGPVPNPLCFTTNGTIPPPGGLMLLRFPPNDILLMWNRVPMPNITYVVYSSTYRFAPWPWPQLVETQTTGFLLTDNLIDGLSHFYIVRAKGGEELSTNSTMAAKTQINFTFDGLKGNVHWISLPYRTEYKKASDISDELTSTRIAVVAKWNPATQTPILWFFLRGGWRGTDFAISPGDGLYIGVVKTFSWVIMGTDCTDTLPFNLNPPTIGNVYWISLPYTSSYSKASSIVFDLEGSIGPGAHTKITELGWWDPVRQAVVKYIWTASGWAGTDFMINPGDGIYLKIITSFTWTPKLITPEVP
jgi:hypothetical protein